MHDISQHKAILFIIVIYYMHIYQMVAEPFTELDNMLVRYIIYKQETSAGNFGNWVVEGKETI